MVEILTKCVDWSLNLDKKKKQFWWNKTYSISIWESNLASFLFSSKVNPSEVCTEDAACPPKIGGDYSEIDDHQVWVAYQRFQLQLVYKLCTICHGPEDNTDMKLCCYCAAAVHQECSHPAHADQMCYKPANAGFEEHLVVCLSCDGATNEAKREILVHTDHARRAVIRSLSVHNELGPTVTARLQTIKREIDQRAASGLNALSRDMPDGARLLRDVQQANRLFFQPGASASWLERRASPSKGGGLGVFALCDIPRFSVVGVYPGYEDPLSGEQAKFNRPAPKYSLVDLNCADYFNRVFTEFDLCFTPFINEPTPEETSNCAWIQEKHRNIGRLSIMTARDIKKGDELLIGYGPLYPRDYPYSYDAYAYHPVDGYDEPVCFALWHWSNTDEKDANFVCYVEYNAADGTYSYWETEEEAAQRNEIDNIAE